MTGKDLLDAIGAVDEDLLEQCLEAEPGKAENNILWFWYGRRYVSIAAFACLFLAFIFGITYWQYHVSSAGDSLWNSDARIMTALLDNCCLGDITVLPETAPREGMDGAQNGADSTQKGKRSNEIDSGPDEEAQNQIMYNAANQSDANVTDDKESYGREGIDDTPGDSGNTDAPSSSDTTIAKIDRSGTTDYSKGISIREVSEIPDKEPQPQPEEPSQPNSDGIKHPDEVVVAKNILAENTAIVRGTIKRIQYYHASGGQMDVYFSVVSLKVKEVYRADGRGNPKKGSICKIYLPDMKNSVSSDTSILRKLKIGREAVLMPYIADAKTGIRSGEDFFAFSDVAEYYFEAENAESHLFLQTKTGVYYNTRIYDIPYSGKKVTLDDVGSYIRNMLKKDE